MLLVFVLTRSGCLAYAHQMLAHLQGVQAKVFCSAYAREPMPAPHRKVITYRTPIEFILNSLWALPQLLLHTVRAYSQGVRRAYFPVFHPWNLALLLCCRMLGVRTFVTVHDGILHAGENNTLLQWLESACIRLADELIFLSRHVEETTRQRIGFSGKAHLIPHALLHAGEVHAERSLLSKPRLLFFGRIARYKGIEMLIEAVEGLPDACYSKLTIAGMMINAPEKTGRPEKISWITKWLEEEEMQLLLRTHDILILPYTEASQSGILTLGISAAIPMVCTRVGGLLEQLNENEAIWTDPTVEGIREGIRQLISDRELYQNIHTALVQRRKNPGWAQSADRLVEILFRD